VDEKIWQLINNTFFILLSGGMGTIPINAYLMTVILMINLNLKLN